MDSCISIASFCNAIDSVLNKNCQYSHSNSFCSASALIAWMNLFNLIHNQGLSKIDFETGLCIHAQIIIMLWINYCFIIKILFVIPEEKISTCCWKTNGVYLSQWWEHSTRITQDLQSFTMFIPAVNLNSLAWGTHFLLMLMISKLTRSQAIPQS